MRAPKSLRLQECGRCKFSCPNRCSRVDMSQLVLTQPWEEVWSGSVSGNSRAETLILSSDWCTRCKASHSLICETKCAFPLTSFPTNPPPPHCLCIYWNPPCSYSVVNPVWPVTSRSRLYEPARICIDMSGVCRKPLTVVLPGGLSLLLAEGTPRRRLPALPLSPGCNCGTCLRCTTTPVSPSDLCLKKRTCAVLSGCCWCVIPAVSVCLNWI